MSFKLDMLPRPMPMFSRISAMAMNSSGDNRSVDNCDSIRGSKLPELDISISSLSNAATWA